MIVFEFDGSPSDADLQSWLQQGRKIGLLLRKTTKVPGHSELPPLSGGLDEEACKVLGRHGVNDTKDLLGLTLRGFWLEFSHMWVFETTWRFMTDHGLQFQDFDPASLLLLDIEELREAYPNMSTRTLKHVCRHHILPELAAVLRDEDLLHVPRIGKGIVAEIRKAYGQD